MDMHALNCDPLPAFLVLIDVCRWGDAPVHTLAALMLLNASQIHWFKDIGYQHDYWMHCPQQQKEAGLLCDCDPRDDNMIQFVDRSLRQCLLNYLDARGEKEGFCSTCSTALCCATHLPPRTKRHKPHPAGDGERAEG
jgi:hypothetical protein